MIRCFAYALTAIFKSKARLPAENLCLRQQLVVLKRRQPRPQIHDADRRFWVLACRWLSEWSDNLIIVKPNTVIRWHRMGWKAYWRWRSSRCESLILKTHWVMVVMDQFTRQLIGFDVHSGIPDGPAVCKMFGRIVGQAEPPTYPSSDSDPLFEFHRWKANLRILGITEIKTVPCVPLSHPSIERLIGKIRREFLGQVPFWGALDLQRKLLSFQRYYTRARVHQSRSGQTPHPPAFTPSRHAANLNDYEWKSYCRGLYQLPIAA